MRWRVPAGLGQGKGSGFLGALPFPCLVFMGCPYSAGVGRTGTFVALLRLLRQLEEEQVVDVFNTVYILRLHRPLMIQTLSQYIFLHSCLLNKILEGPSDASE